MPPLTAVRLALVPPFARGRIPVTSEVARLTAEEERTPEALL